jgi:hypothetical protein
LFLGVAFDLQTDISLDLFFGSTDGDLIGFCGEGEVVTAKKELMDNDIFFFFLWFL